MGSASLCFTLSPEGENGVPAPNDKPSKWTINWWESLQQSEYISSSRSIKSDPDWSAPLSYDHARPARSESHHGEGQTTTQTQTSPLKHSGGGRLGTSHLDQLGSDHDPPNRFTMKYSESTLKDKKRIKVMQQRRKRIQSERGGGVGGACFSITGSLSYTHLHLGGAWFNHGALMLDTVGGVEYIPWQHFHASCWEEWQPLISAI